MHLEFQEIPFIVWHTTNFSLPDKKGYRQIENELLIKKFRISRYFYILILPFVVILSLFYQTNVFIISFFILTISEKNNLF